jgi:hypothetical protein
MSKPKHPKLPERDRIIGKILEHRYVDPNCLLRWAEQRKLRKQKRVILDPYRFG